MNSTWETIVELRVTEEDDKKIMGIKTCGLGELILTIPWEKRNTTPQHTRLLKLGVWLYLLMLCLTVHMSCWGNPGLAGTWEAQTPWCWCAYKRGSVRFVQYQKPRSYLAALWADSVRLCDWSYWTNRLHRTFTESAGITEHTDDGRCMCQLHCCVPSCTCWQERNTDRPMVL